MEIELGKKEAYINLKQFPHILMTGSAGIGKTYTILNIVAQICDTENAGVIYLSDDSKDFKKIEYLCDGSLINKTHKMNEDSLTSLMGAIYKQSEFRVNFLQNTGYCRLSDVDSQVKCYYINNKKYMPDEIVSYFENNEEKFVYVSIKNVWKFGWKSDTEVLIRIMKHANDLSGGGEIHYCKWDKVGEVARKLMGRDYAK